jgi:tetratricopeptide (TPR) repeat protein
MGPRSAVKTHFAFACLVASSFLVFKPALSLAQHPSPQRGPNGGQGDGIIHAELPVTLLVSVREGTGLPLQTSAFVKLSSVAGSLRMTSATEDAGTARFPEVKSGDYNIEVSAAQYKTATEQASIIGSGTNYTVYVYMQPESEAGTMSPARSGPIMSPRLQSEIDKGLDKIRREQYEAARTHFEKAEKMAPANPDVQYLLGTLEYKQQHFDAARAKFEAALSIFPTHEGSLLALGELQIRSRQAELGAQTLEKVYQINGADWRLHFLLAHAYSARKEYPKAEMHASRAVELGKEHPGLARLLLGQVLAAEGKRDEAKRTFEAAVQYSSSDPAATQAKAELAKLENVPALKVPDTKAPEMPEPAPAAAPVATLPVFARPWAPADVDSKEYVIAPDVACPQSELIERAQLRAMAELANFERFTATEHIEHQEVDSNGNPGTTKTHDFAYVVFIEHAKDGAFYLEESRDGGENLDEFPTPLASKGLVSLGVAILDPKYGHDLFYKCEGLGKYRGKAAWQIRFEQRQDAKSRLRTWRTDHGVFFVPLKGRVWVEANTYDVLRVETDLREPQKELRLNRDHLIIDYGPVQFRDGKVSLWLPWYAEMFMEFRGKRYHHRHTLTNYELFSVETNDTISAPNTTTTPE